MGFWRYALVSLISLKTYTIGDVMEIFITTLSGCFLFAAVAELLDNVVDEVNDFT